MNKIFERPTTSGWLILHARRWWVLGFVALLHLLALLLFLDDGGLLDRSEDWGAQFLALLVVSLVLALFFLAMRRTKVTEGFLVVQAFALAVAAYPQGRHPGLIFLIAAIWATELSFWLAKSAQVAVLMMSVFLAMLSIHPLPVLGSDLPSPKPSDIATLVVVGLLLQLICFSARYYVIRTSLQSQEISNLTQALGSLLRANVDLQNYALEVGERSTIEECKRLTREIHDGVGYTMINLKMMLEAATDLSGEESERLRALLEQAKGQVQSGLAETRLALRTFRDIDRVRAEGIRYIHQLVHSFSQATGIQVDVTYGNIPGSFGQEVNAVIYRILQESMTNAIRHGRATRIQIGFWIGDGRLFLSVDDNGTGADEIKPGIGFTGMRERLAPLGGELTLGNGSKGFMVRVEIPWPGK